MTIDDAFVETQPISEFLSSLARELELGSKARDELVRLTTWRSPRISRRVQP